MILSITWIPLSSLSNQINGQKAFYKPYVILAFIFCSNTFTQPTHQTSLNFDISRFLFNKFTENLR